MPRPAMPRLALASAFLLLSAGAASASVLDTLFAGRPAADPALLAMKHDNDLEAGNITLDHSPYRRYRRGPSRNWGVSVEGASDVPNVIGNPAYHVFPDSHITVVNGASGWVIIWSECENYRSVNDNRWLDSSGRMEPYIAWPNIYYGGRKDYRGFDNGGRWLMSVHIHPTNGNPRHFIAFYHAEDGYWPRHPAGGPAWKSIGMVQSWDEGMTWTDYGQIITSPIPRPPDDAPYYGGVGNHDVVWDKGSNRWMLMFSEHQLGIAVSYDPSAMPNSWFKWTGDGFNSPGLYGSFVASPGLDWVPGSNPSIHWNVYVEKWIVIFNGWDNCLHVSGSDDGIHWEGVRTLTCSMDGSRAWYPNIVSPEGGSYWGGQWMKLYHADRFIWPDVRHLVQRGMNFWRGD
ncbi:hypothetical protein DFJ74DRAFT_768045 [Hyaloraphidium curvatum]|nr:hypothetical protein DFJ74DRAFT_768045 [Hyaloraphidium curvatum]